ncbi:hypothetical protein [Methylobacter sp. S3L5C]|uniref:hypothetical protein n=1 Tax=Methylobacter sp. S3L5C TaxID=2839024 RepID=UPI001FACE320|nr:hypothetical protein [Methylobacter sp. S3L5C]UOA07809.1 hypothetical protein KKZ03_16350 [Methylobacter sp. S3L5C]
MRYIIDLKATLDGMYVSAEVELDDGMPALSPEATEEMQSLGAYLVDAAKDWITMSREGRAAYQQRQALTSQIH